MTLRPVAVIALVLVASCSRSTPPAAEPDEIADEGPGCDTVADRSVVLLQQSGDVEPDEVEELRGVVVRLCTDDAWPVGARSCMVDATAHDQLEDCAHQFLSDEAYRRAGNEMERVTEDDSDGQIGLPPE